MTTDNVTPAEARATISEAASLLEQYAEYIATVKANDLERYPYLPLIQQTIEELSLLAFAKEATPPASVEHYAKVAECAFDDRPRSRYGHPSQIGWEDGYRDGIRAAAAAIRALALPVPSAPQGGE